MTDLVQAAQAKVAEIESKIPSLEAERSDLRAKVEIMRKKLPLIRASERSIDPDRLLAELQMMTGELLGPDDGTQTGRSAAATEADIAKLESEERASAELEALKKRQSEA
jgi:hypothetical protein